MMDLYSPGRRLSELAAEHPDDVAVVLARLDGGRETLTWRDLDRASIRLGHALAERGAGLGSFVALGLPNSVEHVIATQAAWKVGACPMPIAPTMPLPERDHLLALADPAVVVGDWNDINGLTSTDVVTALEGEELAPLPDVAPRPFKAIASGGSTGQPKMIVSPGTFAYPNGHHPLAALARIDKGGVVLSPGPLYHNQAFLFSALALYAGASVVFCERFRPELTLALVPELGVTYLNVVPTMMSRMLRVSPDPSSLRTLETVFHMAAPCPDWVKQGWIELVGPERVFELWAATELTGVTIIRGDEWLQHQGSVGRPVATEVRILGPDGEELPPGEIGEIYSRFLGADGPTYEYLGADPLPASADGFRSVGDLGHVDDDGYLYIADRRTDMIVTGGSNVYPAEVENVLSRHPGVADVVVIGLPDDDLGRVVHAIVEPVESDAPPSSSELDDLARQHLAAYKGPRSYECVDALPREATGKIRRGALLEARAAGLDVANRAN